MTEIFKDYFASGDYSKWSIVSGIDNNPPTITSEIAYRGAYCSKHTIPIDATKYRDCYAYKLNLSLPVTGVYMRSFIRIPVLPSLGKALEYVLGTAHYVGPDFFHLKIENHLVDGLRWDMRYRNSGALFDITSITPPILADKWYLIEGYLVQNAGAGIARFYINECNVLEKTGIDNVTGETPVDFLFINCGMDTPDKEYTIYFDVPKVSDEYIGDEPVKCMKLVKNPCSSL